MNKLYFYFLLLAALGLPRVASAAPSNLHCNTTPGPAGPGTVCINSSDEKIPVRVSFRKMPSWSGHSSFLLVDMCEVPEQENILPGKEDSEVVVDDKFDGSLSIGENCIRRYCSEDVKAIGFSINGVPIPAGYVMIRFWLSMESSNFELRCKNIR